MIKRTHGARLSARRVLGGAALATFTLGGLTLVTGVGLAAAPAGHSSGVALAAAAAPVPTTPRPPITLPPIKIPVIKVPPIVVPTIKVPPVTIPPVTRSTTAAPTTTPRPTTAPPTTAPPVTLPTTVVPTTVPTTLAPPTSIPPTTVPPTLAPPTSIPPTSIPPTSIPPTTVAPTTVAPTTTSAPPVDSSVAGQILARVNAERAKVGCNAVALDSRLTAAAAGHAQDMAANDYFSHTSLDGRTFVDRIKAQGYPSPRSENIAAGQPTPTAVMDAWLNSSGHRANILDCSATQMGVASATGGTYGIYWVQDFGTA